MSQTSAALVWFRQDLRLADNPALHAAVSSGAPVLPVFIHDDEVAGQWRPGQAGLQWLRESLARLNESLSGRLLVLNGDPQILIPDLVHEHGISSVYWNRRVEPWRSRRDDMIREWLQSQSIVVRTFNGSLLFDPAEILKKDSTPYRVFTPYYRKGCLERGRPPRTPLPAPDQISFLDVSVRSLSGDESSFASPDWSPGEAGAGAALEVFLSSAIHKYEIQRDIPSVAGVSRLSPHLHFGELSPNQVWHAVRGRFAGGHLSPDADRYLSEIGWREFSHYQLYHQPDLPVANLQRKFNRFPWRDDELLREAWQQGETGFPIVDAGMRQLLLTGYMHNRVRMVVASFLVKNLLQDWRHGASWFWDTLYDADLANNSASWQWVAGCGADAAPYFRIFNPVTQGKKFDPKGDYVRHFVPELKGLPDKYVHRPWEAPAEILASAGIVLDSDYPAPIVDLKLSRQRALDAFKSLNAVQ